MYIWIWANIIDSAEFASVISWKMGYLPMKNVQSCPMILSWNW